MSRITQIPKKLKSAFTKQAGMWLLLELAAVILITTVAGNYIFNYVGGTVSSKTDVSTWEYIYTNSAETPAYSAGRDWSTANTLTPMSKEKTGSYLHLRGTFAGKDFEQTFVIKTDFAPVKISLNGTEVYNNHYGESEYTGNCYNAVKVPASNGGTLAEISIRLPFSAELQTYFSDSGKSAAYTVNTSLVFSLIVLFIGTLSLVSSLIGAAVKKKHLSITASLLITAYGAAAVMPAVSRGSYLLNFPRFYNISAAAELFVIVLFLASVAYVLKIKDKGIVFSLCLCAVTVGAVLFPESVSLLKIAYVVASVAVFSATVALAVKCKGLLNRRIQYAKSIFTVLSFLALLELLCGILQMTMQYRVSFSYCLLEGEFIFLCVITVILSARLFANRNPQIVELKTAKYSEYVTKVADLMKHVLSLDSEEEICKTVADGVYGLYGDVSEHIEDGGLAFSVSVKENSQYREIYNKSLNERVNYSAIEHRCADSGSGCIFAETYFDLVFGNKNGYHLFFHFEGIKNGLSSFFISIIATLYSCIEVAVSHFSLNGGEIENREIEIFSKLADNTEISSGNNADHLECVAYFTKIMLKALGYSEQICETVSKAAMLHDIGKIAIPSEITNKAGLLTEGEREIIKKHTEYGHILLSVFDDDFMRYAAVIAREHHERYDGKGYYGINGESINEYARVVTVADTLDALTTKRSYKEAWPFDTVVEYIDSNSGTMYDPKVVSAMHLCMDEIKKRVSEKE
ncbi:MAG: HD domain-containing protein [Clostridia bacterium]|nr:HD domain-containing protein [Clostridia bacterium]